MARCLSDSQVKKTQSSVNENAPEAGDVPDAKTILKIARALGPEVIERLHRQIVDVATRAGVTHGRRFRIDTTGRRNQCALSDRQLAAAGRRPSADAGDAPRLCGVGGTGDARPQSAAQRGSPGDRDSSPVAPRGEPPRLVRSYRRLMSTTRA